MAQVLRLGADSGVVCLCIGSGGPGDVSPVHHFNTIFGTQSFLIVLTLAFLLALSVGDSI